MYTLVEPNYVSVIAVAKKDLPNANDAFDVTVGTKAQTNIIWDNDVRNLFVSKNGTITDPETGLPVPNQKVVAMFEYPTSSSSSSVWNDYNNYNSDYYFEITYLDDAKKLTTTPSAYKYYIVRFKESANHAGMYAQSKVSVDNNTLNLVNGVLNDYSGAEVANSAFALNPVDAPLYRRFNTEEEGATKDEPVTVKFYRVKSTDKEYLYEDATSKYSKDLGFNFLGVEDKGTADKNAAIFVDPAHVEDTNMPQYLLAVRPNIVEGETILCDASHSHATEEEALACPHTIVTPSYIDAWYLINLKDSISYYSKEDHRDPARVAKFKWNNNYTRLAFVKARHIGDTLVIDNSVYSDNFDKLHPYDVKDSTTVASQDSIFLGDEEHNSVKFSFRLVSNTSNDFLIESEGDKPGTTNGGWIKIQNGVPVIANGTYSEVGQDAEIFNIEKTDEYATANDEVAVSEVSIIGTTGAVIVKGAAGKKVTVSTILGKTVANGTIASDSETIAVPAGIVAVSVDGAEAVKVLVK